jgi:AcrR family transcriptional regulator
LTIQPAVSEHADQMRRRILEGAARAFSRSGPQATSVPEIAAEARVSVGLIYRYFSGKAELYAACCTLGAEAEMAGLMAEMAAIRDPRARLAHAVDFYLSRLAKNGEGALLLGAMAEAQRNPGLQASLRLRRDTIVAFIRRYLEERQAEGEVVGSVAPLARAIAMTMDGALTELALGDSDLGSVREAILDLLERLLQASGPAPT